jgi:hypothetical protein
MSGRAPEIGYLPDYDTGMFLRFFLFGCFNMDRRRYDFGRLSWVSPPEYFPNSLKSILETSGDGITILETATEICRCFLFIIVQLKW